MAFKKRFQSTLIVLVSFIVTILVSEFGLRVFLPKTSFQTPFGIWSWLVNDPILAWSNKPGHHEEKLRINAHGFRGKEIQTTSSKSSIRIVCLGDSGTFGIYKKAEGDVQFPSYPAKLEALLQKQNPSIEVINAGVLGYSSFHGIRQLMTQILPLNPNILLVRFGLNDHSYARHPVLKAQEPESPLAQFLLYTFYDWQWTRLTLQAYQQWQQATPHPPVFRATLEEFESNIKRFAEIAHQHQIHVVFLDYPLRKPGTGHPPDGATLGLLGVKNLHEKYVRHQKYQNTLKKVVQQNELQLIETQTAFEQSSQAPFGPYDMIHPNEHGMALIAKQVATQLLD